MPKRPPWTCLSKEANTKMTTRNYTNFSCGCVLLGISSVDCLRWDNVWLDSQLLCQTDANVVCVTLHEDPLAFFSNQPNLPPRLFLSLSSPENGLKLQFRVLQAMSTCYLSPSAPSTQVATGPKLFQRPVSFPEPGGNHHYPRNKLWDNKQPQVKLLGSCWS